MTNGPMKNVLGHLRRLATRNGGDLSDRADGQLLARFVQGRDEAAFEALVRRHGPMVLGVCRRLLGNRHDAEDAFQAAFLVLVRKAAGIRQPELLGNWLYGVAYRTALEARAILARRRARERQVHPMPEPAIDRADVGEAAHDWRLLVDRELSRLPDKYRVPVVLCELQGRSRKEVARQLKIPEGTLSSRLATARKRLARRLGNRGITLSAGTLASALGAGSVSARVPPSLIESTVRAALLTAAGPAAFTGVMSTDVAALTEGVLKAMFVTKLKSITLALVAVVFLILTAGVLTHELSAGDGPAADAAKGSLRDTLLILDKQFWEASSKHDLDTLKRLIADDYHGIGHDGTRWNKTGLLQQMSEVRTGDLKLHSEREVLRVNAQAAILTYEASFKVYNRDGTLRDTARQRLSSCWVQRDGGWFVFFAQAADRRDAGTAQQPDPMDGLKRNRLQEKEPRININTAPPEVLRAIPGLSERDVQAIMKARAALEPKPEPARRNTLQRAVLNEIDAKQGTLSTTLAVEGRFPARFLTSVLDPQLSNTLLVNEVYAENKRVPFTVYQEDKLATLKTGVNYPTESVLQKDAKLENVPVAKDATIIINGKPAKLSDLKKDMVISLELAIEGNRLVVRSIRVEE